MLAPVRRAATIALAAALAAALAPACALGSPAAVAPTATVAAAPSSGSGSAPVTAAPAISASATRAIVVLVDCATLADVTRADLPGFSAMRAAGSMGLTTVPIGVGAHNEAAYATIGQGSPMATRGTPPELTIAYAASETIGPDTALQAYTRNTGDSPGGAAIVNPQIFALAKAYLTVGARMPGVLGQSLLRSSGRPSVALVGDADGSLATQMDRSASLVAMTASGTIGEGAIGTSTDVTDTTAPLGRRTDFGLLFARTQAFLATNRVVVVETGDLERARVEAPFAISSAASIAHERALKATDAFVAQVAALASDRTMVLVVSTSVPAGQTGAGRSLAPVLVAGGGFPAGGALASATTRHEGVVTLHDLAPTVLAHLGVAPAAPMVGLRITGRADPCADRLLSTTLDRAGALHSQRVAAINAFIALQTLLLIALCVPWVQRRVLRSARAWWVLPYAAGTAALAIVLQPAIGSPALPVALAAVALIALATASMAAALRDRVLALALISTATVGALALDLAAGAPLARWSYLGYDIVVGGRFYGVGNEYEGVFVGASVIAAACLVALAGRHRKLAVAAVGAGCIALIAMFALPRLGADAGGALAAAVGVGVTFYGFAGGRFTWRRVLALVGGLVVLGIAGLAIASALGGGAGSHVGRFLARIEHGDLAFAANVVLGKLKANLHLLAVSPWRSVVLAAAVVIGVLWWRERAALTAGMAAEPDLARGVAGLVAGGVAVLALNDSGVVAISTLAPFAVLLALTLTSRGRAVAGSAAAGAAGAASAAGAPAPAPAPANSAAAVVAPEVAATREPEETRA